MLARLFAALPARTLARVAGEPALRDLDGGGCGALLCAAVVLWTREAAAGWWPRRSSAPIPWSGCTPPRPRCSASTPCSWRSRSCSGFASSARHARRLVFALLLRLRSGHVQPPHLRVRGRAAGAAIASGWRGAHSAWRHRPRAAPSAWSGFCPTSTSGWPRPRQPRCRGATRATLDGLLTHVLRRNYGTFSMGQAAKGGAFVDEGTFLPDPVADARARLAALLLDRPAARLPGLLRLRQGSPRAKSRALLSWAILAWLRARSFPRCPTCRRRKELYVTVLVRFCIQSDLMLALAAGLGLLLAHGDPAQPFGADAALPRALRPLGAVLLLALAVAAHAGECNQRHNRVFADFVTTAFASLPGNAIVITMGDHLTGSVFYFREVEKLRPDVIHLDRELLGTSWYGARKRKLHPDLYLARRQLRQERLEHQEAARRQSRPAAGGHRSPGNLGSKLERRLQARHQRPGPPARARREFPDFDEWLARDRNALGNYDVHARAALRREGSWEYALGQAGHDDARVAAPTWPWSTAPSPAMPRPRRASRLPCSRTSSPRPAATRILGIAALARACAASSSVPRSGRISASATRSFRTPMRPCTPKVALAYEKFVERCFRRRQTCRPRASTSNSTGPQRSVRRIDGSSPAVPSRQARRIPA